MDHLCRLDVIIISVSLCMPCTVGLIIRLPMHATTPLEVTECCLLDLSRGCVVVPMTVSWPKIQSLKFTFYGKVILHMPIKFEHDRMKSKWLVREKRSFFSEKNFLGKFLDPKTHFWKFTFLGKVIQHMHVKFEHHGKINKWVVRKKW